MNETQTTDVSNESIDLFANDDASQPIADTGSDRDTSNEQQTNTQTPKGEKTADDASISKEAKADPKVQPEQKKFVTRGEKREQEIKASLAENKRILEEIRRERTQPPQAQQNQAPQEPVFVEQPKKPQFSREEITKAYKEAQASGNQAVIEACLDANKEWDRYETDLKFWKIENGQKIERFQSHRQYYWKQAAEKVKHLGDLNDANSEIRQECDKLAKFLPEVLKRTNADGEYLIAQLAAMRIERRKHSSEVGALKDQVKQLTDKLGAAQKRVQPASQGVAPSVSKAGEGLTPEERLLSRLEAAQAA
jgi:hypothetical protein